MKLDEETLKELMQLQTARSTSRQKECLTEEEFLKAATGQASSTERLRVARHLINCADCTAEYRVVRSFKPLSDEAERMLGDSSAAPPRSAHAPVQPLYPSVEKPAPSSRWSTFLQPRSRSLAAVAAMVVVAVGSVVVWQWIKFNEPPTSSERAPVSSSLTVEPPSKASLSEPPEKLSWPAVRNAITYRVVIYDFQSTPIWESPQLKETAATIPDSVRGRLVRNRPYYWRVFAEDVIEQRQSELFEFTLAAEEAR